MKQKVNHLSGIREQASEDHQVIVHPLLPFQSFLLASTLQTSPISNSFSVIILDLAHKPHNTALVLIDIPQLPF